jgi:hypothetical protein
MFLQFFKILFAVIIIKITGYALIVTLFLHKVALATSIKSVLTLILFGNFFLVWLSFKRIKGFPWPMVIACLNFGAAALIVKTLSGI